MEVRIGMTQVAKELDVELADDVDGTALSKEIERTVESGSGVLWLTDKRGRRIGIAVAKIAYIEIGPLGESHRVGFVPPASKKK